MKKLLNILSLMLLLFSFSSSGLMAQIEGENGWWQFPWENIDPRTRNYLTHQGSQIFENISKFSSDSSKNTFQVTWFKNFEPQIDFPDSFHFRYKIIEESGSLLKKRLYLFLQDSTGGWVAFDAFGDIDKYDWDVIKIPIKEIFERIGAPIMEKILIVYMVFWMRFHDPFSEVGLTVEMDYFSGVYPDGSEVIYDDFGDIVSVPEEKVIEDFVLYQNYPNPFNPTTTITFSVPKTEHVFLGIYNVLGQKITTLLNEVKSAGNYHVNYNAANLPSGVYFYTLTTGAQRITKKMMLAK